MSDEGKLRQDSQRGTRAATILGDPLLAEIFATIHNEYVAAWFGSETRDAEGRERLWQAVKIVERVQVHLQKIANDGKLARAELDDLQGKAQGIIRKVFG